MRAKALAAIVVLFAINAYAAHAADPPKVRPLSLPQLLNMTYKVEDATNGVAQLHNGEFRDKPTVPGSATCLEVSLWEPVAHGDLNGDGIPDAAVILISDPGGSGTFVDLAVVLNENGIPRHMASVGLGDRVKILSMVIRDRVVTVDMLTQGPNDPMADPTKREYHSYSLKDGKLIEAAPAGNESNRDELPKKLKALLNASHLLDSWEVDRTAKPLYLRGDFDGDGKRDYAVFLKARHGGASTIAVLFSAQEARLVSSEKEIGDNYPGPDWQLHPQKKTVRSRRDLNDEHRPPRLRGDAIILDKPESSSALLYWNAGHLRLYWLSD